MQKFSSLWDVIILNVMWGCSMLMQFLHAVGGVDVTTTDGITKRFADGDVLLVEDTKGHVALLLLPLPQAHLLMR